MCGLFVVMGGTASGGIDDPIFVKGDEGILYLINHTGCPLCHTIPGIDGAVGELGPKLTKKNMELSFENPEYKGKAKNLREYVVESILKPSAYVVYNIEEDEPYPEGLMPSTFREQMTDNALNKIVEYLLNPKVISDEEYKIYAKQQQIDEKQQQIDENEEMDRAQRAYDAKDYETALDIYLYFAEDERWGAVATMQLAQMYEVGEGVSQDYKEALKWHLLAAKQHNNSWSQFVLGTFYSNGQGVQRNEQESINWYKKASKQGMDLASYNIGVFYFNKNNLVEAEKWYKIALEQGYEKAKEKLEKIKKIRKAEKEERQRAAKEKKEKAAKQAKFNKIMKEAEKYRDVVSKSEGCKKAEDLSKCITVNSCVAASIIEQYKHDDRGKKFKKTIEGGLLSKGSYSKAFDELIKSAEKDELLKNQVKKITMSCIFR